MRLDTRSRRVDRWGGKLREKKKESREILKIFDNWRKF